MADTTYTVNQDDPNTIEGFEQFSQTDKDLIGTFEVNNLFNPNVNLSELHIYSLTDELLESHYDYSNYKQLGNAQSAGKSGASILTIDPIEDSKLYGYDNGGIKLLYHFLNDLYTEDKSAAEFYIDSISEDRTEVRLVSLTLSTRDITSYTTSVKNTLQNASYFSEFRLNFKNNDLFIGVNIDTVDLLGGKAVVVKLYEPLPDNYNTKSTLSIVEIVSDSVAYEVDTYIVLEEDIQPTIRPANFNLEITDEHVIPTQYFNYNELFSYPVNNVNSEIYSVYSEKGAEISINHSDFSNFIHFSSAYERLVNFKYKFDLITLYSGSIASGSNATTGMQGISGSKVYYENLLTGILNNFDHYERFLYYESGSNSWPKVNTAKPYINQISTTTEAVNWYTAKISEAYSYDNTNYNSIINAIPSYLRDDSNNENYLLFVSMIGQHFDNLWIYGKAVTDKYDGDNRLDFGISKDLVGEALKNFGVKLYTSNKSTEDLFSSIIGQSYQSGSEQINYYITGSLTGSNTPIQPTSYDNYNKEVQKRIYHNLSHLLKTKGTERGLRALINCFGIPSDILKIKLYGGRNTDNTPFYGDYQYYTSSLDKIRLDNTGSLITGSILSQYTSNYKRDIKYTDDLHAIEVGFSPTDSVDSYIVSYSLATSSLSSFSIDSYIGDPRNLTLDTYGLLDSNGNTVSTLSDLTNTIMSSSDAYDVFDYVRLIKFFDNTIFKMVRDFIPARVTADTGIIIKPSLLNRSKAKSVQVEVTQPEYSGSIDTAFISGSNARSFGAKDDYITSYTTRVQTPFGIGSITNNLNEQPKFNGELYNSGIVVTNGELNEDNPYKQVAITPYTYTIRVWDIANVCIFNTGSIDTVYVLSSTQTYPPTYFFPNGTLISTVYTSSNPAGQVIYPTMPVSYSGYTQYQNIYMTASNGVLEEGQPECIDVVNVVYGTCSLALTTGGIVTQSVAPGAIVNLNTWFNIHPSQSITYTVTTPLPTIDVYGPVLYNTPISHPFPSTNTTAIVTVNDPQLGGFCSISKTVDVNVCILQPYTNTLRYSVSTEPQLLTGPPYIDIGTNPWPLAEYEGESGLSRYFRNDQLGVTTYTIYLYPNTTYQEAIPLGTSTVWSIPAGYAGDRIVIEAATGDSCKKYVTITERDYTWDGGSEGGGGLQTISLCLSQDGAWVNCNDITP